jgi:hypothetical protein
MSRATYVFFLPFLDVALAFERATMLVLISMIGLTSDIEVVSSRKQQWHDDLLYQNEATTTRKSPISGAPK